MNVKDIDSILGTHLANVSDTINNTQDAVNSIAPTINFLQRNWIYIIFVIILLMIATSFIGTKLAR